MRHARPKGLLRLVLWSCAALVVFRLVDSGLYAVIAPRWPSLAVLPDLRLSSLLLLASALIPLPRWQDQVAMVLAGAVAEELCGPPSSSR